MQGLKLFAEQAGLLEYLLNRCERSRLVSSCVCVHSSFGALSFFSSTETGKIGHDWKHLIIKVPSRWLDVCSSQIVVSSQNIVNHADVKTAFCEAVRCRFGPLMVVRVLQRTTRGKRLRRTTSKACSGAQGKRGWRPLSVCPGREVSEF